jgi:hypothetical protein
MVGLYLLGVDIFASPIVLGVVTGLPERASIVQKDLVEKVTKFRPSKARTLATFEEATRKKTARLAGIQMGYWKDHANGQTWYSPITGATSMKKSTKQKTGAMYAGVVFRNMNFWMEKHIMKDMERGFIPDSYIEERERRIETHMWKKNWAAIGNGTGAIGIVSSASGTTVTLKADNSARGSSKGTFRLQITDSTDTLLYDAINASGAVVATFYVTAKPTTTTATVVFTVGNAAAMNTAGFLIVESGSYNLELNGIGYHNSDSASRIYQGADAAEDAFFRNLSIDAGNVAVTPTAIHSAKGAMMTRCNESEDAFPFICHTTYNNYRDLAKFGYTLRTVEQTAGKAAMKTIGVPNVYEDGDTIFVPDADYEECYMDFRERAPFFEYVQKEFGRLETDGIGRFQYAGTNAAGSTNEYENYNEAVNIVWDGRGKNGDKKGGGTPNTGVFIYNIAQHSQAQYILGV